MALTKSTAMRGPPVITSVISRPLLASGYGRTCAGSGLFGIGIGVRSR
jgi:hypothetical protein